MTPWTAAHQVPLSMEFSRQEYWTELPFPSPGELPNPPIEPGSPELQAHSLSSEPPGKLNYIQSNAILNIQISRHKNHGFQSLGDLRLCMCI